MLVVGLYTDTISDFENSIGPTQRIKKLHSLEPTVLHQCDCVLVDVRSNTESILRKASTLNGLIPVIALANHDTPFPIGYPFECSIHDHITPIELGGSLFWHRVASAVANHDMPMDLSTAVQPIYDLFRQIVNHSSDWIFIKDLDHRFLLANEKFSNLAGFSVSEILGKNDLEIGHSPEHVFGDGTEKLPGFWNLDDKSTNSGEITVEENPHWDLFSKTERTRLTIRVPLKNHKGRVYALLVCSQDITDQRKNEILLKDRTEMLSRVTREKQSADKNRLVAEEAVKAKAKFLAAASHDLRQPLHAMGLFLDILNTRMIGDKEQHLVQQLKQSCAALNGLFNGCLDISRLDAGVIEREDENFYAAEFIESLGDEFKQQALEKNLDYRCEVDDSVLLTDSMLLTRIIRNLVNNAINNTEQGQIIIRCIKSDSRTLLSVTDTGVGIHEQEQEQIFNEFHQIGTQKARHGKGLGLGLAIVKRLCQLLDVELTLKSKLGQGSCFTLNIASGSPDRIVYETATDSSLSLKGARVLIVDDDPSIRLGMEALLQSHDCDVVSGPDASTVLQALKECDMVPNVIVADYHLGSGTSGTNAIEQIRQALGSQIPAFLVTGDTSEECKRDAQKQSLLMLNKPVDSDVLLTTIAGKLKQPIVPVH